MADVTLSAAVRDSLLSLQNTTGLIERTQGRLSTGLRVNSAVDDPVAFFQAKGLSDRSSDFTEKKDGIDQGISTVTAALDGVEGIENLVQQMKGIAQSMKAATDSQMSDLVSQYNDLRGQINNLTADSTYQGTNLINGTGQTLQVEFSEKTASKIRINSTDMTSEGLAIDTTTYYQKSATFAANFTQVNLTTGDVNTLTAAGAGYLRTSDDFTVTWAGPAETFTAGSTANLTYGTGSTVTVTFSSGADTTLTNGGTMAIDITTAGAGNNHTASAYVHATAQTNGQFSVGAGTTAMSKFTAGETFTMTYSGPDKTLTAGSSITLQYGTGVSMTVELGTADTVYSAGETIVVTNVTAATHTAVTAGAAYVTGDKALSLTATSAVNLAATTDHTGALYGVSISTDGDTAFAPLTAATNYVVAGDTDLINNSISELDTALTSLRTESQKLGTNVALLSTRLDFTESYVNTLTSGAGKLTLADMNSEGANLLALQTRQQLGIQALSLSGQAESAILQLF